MQVSCGVRGSLTLITLFRHIYLPRFALAHALTRAWVGLSQKKRNKCKTAFIINKHAAFKLTLGV